MNDVLPCPSCGASIEFPDGAQRVACESCGSRFVVEAHDGEVALGHEVVRSAERPFFVEAHVPRSRGRRDERWRSVQTGCSYAILAFVSATIVGFIVVAGFDIEADMTLAIALIAAWAGVTGFVIGYRHREK